MVSVRSSVTAMSLMMLAAACASPTSQNSPTTPSLTTSAATSGVQGKAKIVVTAITFADRAGDAITSDGSGYPDGQLLSSGQMGLLLRGTARRLNFNLNGFISGTGPTGTLNDDTNVAVDDVSSIPVGSAQPRRAIFSTSVGQFNFDSSSDPQTNSGIVTHVNATTWTVDTSAGDVAVLAQSMPDPNNPHKTITVKGYYHLAFSFTGVTQ